MFKHCLRRSTFRSTCLTVGQRIIVSRVPIRDFRPCFFNICGGYELGYVRGSDYCYFPSGRRFFLLVRRRRAPSIRILTTSSGLICSVLLFIGGGCPRASCRLFELGRCRTGYSCERLSTCTNVSTDTVRQEVDSVASAVHGRRKFSGECTRMDVWFMWPMGGSEG